MTREAQETDKQRSRRLFEKRLLCFEHAGDLIEAAERVLSTEHAMPNIAFHLILLAIEEMGKAALITSKAVAAGGSDTRRSDKHLEDHAFKLLWGLWSPSFHRSSEIDPGLFQKLRNFSQQAHLQRLSGLYVETSDGESAFSAPKDKVTLEEATSLLGIAKQNLRQFLDEGSPDLESGNELLQWFRETIADDLGRQRLFSGPFMAKYSELAGEAKAWALWAQSELTKIKQEEESLLKSELSRVAHAGPSSKPRWKMNVRIYCISHSIRPKVLSSWNDNVPTAQLKFAKNGELLLELTLGDQINLANLFDAGLSMSKLLVACLNIGTAGFFWFETPTRPVSYFEKVQDLANPDMKVEIGKGLDLQHHWLTDDEGRKLTVLENVHLDNAARCAVAFGPMSDEYAAPIFGTYLYGLTLLGKSDMHLALDNLAFAAFGTVLQNALKHFRDWDGLPTTLVPTLHRVLSEIIPETEKRDILLKYWRQPPSSVEELQEYTVTAKRVADLYLVVVANRLWEVRALEGSAPGGDNQLPLL